MRYALLLILWGLGIALVGSAENPLAHAIEAARSLESNSDRGLLLAECGVLADLGGDPARAAALYAEAQAVEIPAPEDPEEADLRIYRQVTLVQGQLLSHDLPNPEWDALEMSDRCTALAYPMLMTARLGRQDRVAALKPAFLATITAIGKDDEAWLNLWEITLIAARTQDEALLEVVLSESDGVAARTEWLATWVEESALAGHPDQARLDEAATAAMLMSFGGGGFSERMWPLAALGSAYAAMGQTAKAEIALAELEAQGKKADPDEAWGLEGALAAIRLALAEANWKKADVEKAKRWAIAAMGSLDPLEDEWNYRDIGRRLTIAGADEIFLMSLVACPTDPARVQFLLGVAEGSLARAGR